MLENIIAILHWDLQDAADEVPSKVQRALLGPFFREVLDCLGGLVHGIIQRVDLRFVLGNDRLSSGSQFRRENKRLPRRRDQDHLFRKFGWRASVLDHTYESDGPPSTIGDGNDMPL